MAFFFLNISNIEFTPSSINLHLQRSQQPLPPLPPPSPSTSVEILMNAISSIRIDHSTGLSNLIIRRLISNLCQLVLRRVESTTSSGSELNYDAHHHRPPRRMLHFSDDDDDEDNEPLRHRQRLASPSLPPPPPSSPQLETSQEHQGLGFCWLHISNNDNDDDDDDDVDGNQSLIETLHESEDQKSPSRMCTFCTHSTNNVLPRPSSSSSLSISLLSQATTLILSDDDDNENQNQDNLDDSACYLLINVDYNSDGEHPSSSSYDDDEFLKGL